MTSVGNVPLWVWLQQEYESEQSLRWMRLNHGQAERHIFAHQSALLSVHIPVKLFQNIYNCRLEKCRLPHNKGTFQASFHLRAIHQWTVTGFSTVSGTWNRALWIQYVPETIWMPCCYHSFGKHATSDGTAVTLQFYSRVAKFGTLLSY
jgi:hypothetical protein